MEISNIGGVPSLVQLHVCSQMIAIGHYNSMLVEERSSIPYSESAHDSAYGWSTKGEVEKVMRVTKGRG